MTFWAIPSFLRDTYFTSMKRKNKRKVFRKRLQDYSLAGFWAFNLARLFDRPAFFNS